MISRYSVHYEKFFSQFLPFQAFINIIREWLSMAHLEVEVVYSA